MFSPSAASPPLPFPSLPALPCHALPLPLRASSARAAVELVLSAVPGLSEEAFADLFRQCVFSKAAALPGRACAAPCVGTLLCLFAASVPAVRAVAVRSESTQIRAPVPAQMWRG